MEIFISNGLLGYIVQESAIENKFLRYRYCVSHSLNRKEIYQGKVPVSKNTYV